MKEHDKRDRLIADRLRRKVQKKAPPLAIRCQRKEAAARSRHRSLFDETRDATQQRKQEQEHQRYYGEQAEHSAAEPAKDKFII